MIESLVNNVYKGPATDALQRGFDGWVWGEVRISDFEMRTYSGAGHEDAFVGILQARIQSTLDAMIDEVKYELRPDDTDALDDPIDTLER